MSIHRYDECHIRVVYIHSVEDTGWMCVTVVVAEESRDIQLNERSDRKGDLHSTLVPHRKELEEKRESILPDAWRSWSM